MRVLIKSADGWGVTTRQGNARGMIAKTAAAVWAVDPWGVSVVTHAALGRYEMALRRAFDNLGVF